MGYLFRYKFPTTLRWYVRHRMAGHFAVAFMAGCFVTWFAFLAWAYILLN